jgi:hypothetical protein
MKLIIATLAGLAVLATAQTAQARTIGHRTAHVHGHAVTRPVIGEHTSTWPPIITPGGPRGGAGAPGGPPPVPPPACSIFPGCAILIG